MNIKMTIEVSAETAVKVARLLSEGQAVRTECAVTQAPVMTAPTYNAPTTAAVQTTAPQQYGQQAPTAAPVQNPPQPTAAPTSAVTYTIDQLQTAIAPLLDAGKVSQIQQLVQSFGVNTLMEIPQARYGEFANGLRQLGGVL